MYRSSLMMHGLIKKTLYRMNVSDMNEHDHTINTKHEYHWEFSWKYTLASAPSLEAITSSPSPSAVVIVTKIKLMRLLPDED